MRIIITGCILSVLVASCSAGGGGTHHTGAGGSGSGMGGTSGVGGDITLTDAGSGSGGFTGGDTIVPPGCTANCMDFPSTPILDGNVPANPGSLFGAPDNFTPGLCIAEPHLSSGNVPGAILPANWLRARFRVKPANGENLFEIRIHVKSEANDLVAYTTNTIWSIPKDIWAAMGVKGNAIDQPITVTIRGVNVAAPGKPTGGQGTFTIAPVTAGGSMVYWATTSSDVAPNTSKLVGFYVGNETVGDALLIPQAQQTGILHEDGNNLRGMFSNPYGVPPGHVQCVGCHTSTPDGLAVGFTDHWPWNSVFASIEEKTVGAVPAWLSPGAQRLLNQPWMGMMTMTKAHWKDGDRVALVPYSNRNVGVGFTGSYGSGNDKLAWFELDTSTSIPWMQGQVAQLNQSIQAAQGTAWGFLNLNGETAGVVSPHWSHDGQNIVYTSATKTQDGRIGDNAETDIHMVPYNNRMGGQVTSISGASSPGVSEYYPSFSADDKLIAFNRANATSGKIYYRPDGEVQVIAATGGSPTRLSANDPPACTGETSPGIINSWAKWSPTALTHPVNGNTYYWMIFSSARDYPGKFIVPKNQYSPPDTRSSQLYMTAVVKDSQGNLTTYPAVYIWNQDPATSNLTPAWDIFQIPQPPPPK